MLPSLMLLLALSAVQYVRPAINLDPNPATPSQDAAVGMREELAAMAFVETEANGGQAIYLSLSDGRGIDWSPAIRLDQDANGAAKSLQQHAVVVFGDTIHVAWLDWRHGNAELYSIHSADRGATWSAEVPVPKGQALGQGEIVSWSMTASPRTGGGPDHVYALCRVGQASSNAALYFSASHDGGRHFQPAQHLPSAYQPGAAEVASLALAAPREDGAVYVLWQDNHQSAGDLYFQASSDHGDHWLPAPRQMNGQAGTVAPGISLSEAGFRVQAAWRDTSLGAPRLLVDWSEDRGVTWRSNPQQVGNYTAGSDQVIELQCLRNRQLLTVIWTDDRSGRAESYLASWTPTSQQWQEFSLSTSGAAIPQVIGHRHYMAAFWQDLATPPSIWASFSRDKGESWDQPVFAATTTVGREAAPRIAFSKTYGNFLLAWQSDDSGQDQVYVGGFRGQTVETVGSLRVASPLAFAVHAYAADESGWEVSILLSRATGNAQLPFGDGRSLGLASDAFFRRSARLSAPSALQATIASDGSGSTPSVVLPPVLAVGDRLVFVAVSRDPLGGFGHITDALTEVILP